MPVKRKSVSKSSNALLRSIPSVDELLASPRLSELSLQAGRTLVVQAARSVLAALRSRIAEHPQDTTTKLEPGELATQLIGEIIADVETALKPSLRPVINATGVVLHTNLGRAPLGAEFFQHIRTVATQYSNLEYDLETGARGTRDVHTSRLLQKLTGAESAIVVNNNAAAVFLVLAALARGGEVIVSRG